MSSDNSPRGLKVSSEILTRSSSNNSRTRICMKTHYKTSLASTLNHRNRNQIHETLKRCHERILLGIMLQTIFIKKRLRVFLVNLICASSILLCRVLPRFTLKKILFGGVEGIEIQSSPVLLYCKFIQYTL